MVCPVIKLEIMDGLGIIEDRRKDVLAVLLSALFLTTLLEKMMIANQRASLESLRSMAAP